VGCSAAPCTSHHGCHQGGCSQGIPCQSAPAAAAAAGDNKIKHIAGTVFTCWRISALETQGRQDAAAVQHKPWASFSEGPGAGMLNVNTCNCQCLPCIQPTCIPPPACL
jgi:hypothetical protein